MTGLDPTRWGATQSDAAIRANRARQLPDGWVLDDASHLEVAIATARFAPVFPCLATKRPATEHGFHDAHTDEKRIRAWWSRHPDHLVAIPTAGLVVIDLDDRPDRPPSWGTWCELAEPHGWEPTHAPMAGTPSGGVHIYYRAPDGTEVRNSASKLAHGIDVRADGGYVIAPGSHLPDGRGYELLSPFPAELPAAPDWLIEMCVKPALATSPSSGRAPAPIGRGGSRYGLGALETELGRLATVKEGERNDSLVRSAYRAGQLVGGGELDAHHAHAELLIVAIRIGLDERESENAIASGLRSGAQVPRRRAS